MKLINSERYIISKINLEKKEMTINHDRNEVIISKDDFQKLFRIGYVFTTHSVQGHTINEPYTIHEWDKMHKKLNMSHLVEPQKKNT